MLTVDFERFPVEPGATVLDLGCGAGRHAFAVARRGAHVVAVDRDRGELLGVAAMFAAMRAEGQLPAGTRAGAVCGDAGALPFADAVFDRVVASEVLEHLTGDETAMAELARVLRPGGLLAVSVPRWLPERVCWALSRAYHEVPGGHVRIYRGHELVDRLTRTGLQSLGSHHAHALHAPYWWLKCAIGPHRDDAPLARAYHALLVWDMVRAPWPTRLADRLLNPLIGKSLVVYLRKPEEARVAA